MTEAPGEPILTRTVRLNRLFLERNALTLGNEHLLSRETLLDALFVLFEECNNDPLRKDKYISIFIEKFRTVISELRRLRVNIGDFEVKRVIGRGHFGDVQVVREKQTGNVYAMKVLRKSETLSQQNVAFYEEERDIMAKGNSPWITQLQYAFQDRNNLYLVMEFHPGGDLLALLERYDNILTEDMARFYLAEMVLSIQALHNMGYVHRDIKPDNILVDRTGHIKLADFGSSAKLSPNNTVSSMMPVGTPDYIAPEVLVSIENKRGTYGRGCDWWSLGIVAYEMLYGQTPFTDDKAVNTYHNIMNHKSKLTFSDDIEVSLEARELICGLLEDPEDRLDFERLSRHTFFITIDWGAVRETRPPFVPTVTSLDDTSNFEEFEPLAHKPNTTFGSKPGFSGINLPFVGFTFSQHGDITGDVSPAMAQLDHSPKKRATFTEKTVGPVKQELQLLQKKIDSLEKRKSERAAELERLTNLVKEYEKDKEISAKEIELVKKELATALTKNATVSKLLELELQEREKTEKKAMELIRDIKLKWQAAEQKKTEEIMKENANLREFVRELETKYKDAKVASVASQKEMMRAYKIAEDSKAEVKRCKDKMMAKRQSSVGELVNMELSQQQCVLLRKQLEESEESKAQLQSKLSAMHETAESVKVQLDHLEGVTKKAAEERVQLETELQNKIKVFKENLRTATSELAGKETELKAQETVIQDLERNLAAANESREKLQLQLEEMRTKTANSPVPAQRLSRQNSDKRPVKMAARLEELENQVRELTSENENLQVQLMNVKDSDCEKSNTVEELRDVIERLEEDLKRLGIKIIRDGAGSEDSPDNNADAPIEAAEIPEMVELQTRVSKLEAQLERARKVAADEKKAANDLTSDVIKRDRELRDLKIDLRIAVREGKALSEQLTEVQGRETILLQEKEKAEERLAELEGSLATLERELKDTTEKSEAGKQSAELESAKLIERIENLQKSCNDLRNAQTQRDQFEGRANELAKQIKYLEDQLKRSEEDKKRSQQQEDQLRSELREEKHKSENLQLNNNILREATTSLDDEMRQFEILIQHHENEEAQLNEKLSATQAELDDLRKEVVTANESAELHRRNLEEALKEREALERQHRVDGEMQSEEMQVVVTQRNEYWDTVRRLTQDLANLDGQRSAYEAENANLKVTVEALNREVVRIKEEASSQITQLYSFRETNFKLSRDLEEAVAENRESEALHKQLENVLQEAKLNHHVDKIKLEQTIAQQTKLINYLQGTMETKVKKKKTFQEKLFGRKDSARLTPAPVAHKTLTKIPVTPNASLPPPQSTTSSSRNQNGIRSSPQSQAFLNTLSQPPGLQESPDRPSSEKGIPKASVQRMHHSIPHRFKEKMAVHPTKCASCYDGIQFGRTVARCEDCFICAHPKCAVSLPHACGLPFGLMQHFRHSMRNPQKGQKTDAKGQSAGDQRSSKEECEIEGAVKISRNGDQGWDHHFARLTGTTLSFYASDAGRNGECPLDIFELRPENGDVKLTESVLPVELDWTANSDLPFVFKLEAKPFTTCWPGRCLYVMASGCHEKLAWISALEKIIKTNSSNEEESAGALLLRLKNAAEVDLNCACYANMDTVFVGAEEGLYYVNLFDELDNEPSAHVKDFGAINQIQMIESLQMLIVIVGNDQMLSWIPLSSLMSVCKGEVTLMADIVRMMQPMGCINSCHRFVTSEQDGTLFVFAATASKVVLLKWNASMKAFCVRKEIESQIPCSCAVFTANSVIFGTTRFYELDLANFLIEEFLDEADPSLAHICTGALRNQSYPIDIHQVSPGGAREEYLLCFHEFGLFVDAFGTRSRLDDIRWSRVPLIFAFRWPYLFVLHFNSVEICEISPQMEKGITSQIFVGVPNPRYLGPGLDSGTIVLAVAKQTQVDVMCLDGELATKRKVGGTPQEAEPTNESTLDDDADVSDFSFTSSVIQALDRPDSPTESSV